MFSSRRFACLAALLAAFILGTLALGRQPAIKAPVPKDVPVAKEDKDDFGDNSAISLPRDNKLKSQIEAAVDYIREEDWVLATEILQKLVSIKEDVFAKLPRKTPEGKNAEIWTSVRAEANRLIASLPPKGMAFYQLTYGPKAAEMLKEAKATNKPELLALIMRLYLHTTAGGEATDLLGTYHLDRGNFSTASRCFSLLLSRPGSENLAPVTLFKAAYAFHQTGAAEDKAAEEQAWKLLGSRVREVKLGDGEARSIDELKSCVASSVRPAGEIYASDFPLYRGNASRAAQGVGSYAFMEPRWVKSCIRGNRETSDTARWLRNAEEQLKRNNQPILSSFFPVTATVLHRDAATGRTEKTPLLIYRSNWGVHAVHMKTGQLEWEMDSKWSLDSMVAGGAKFSAIQGWMSFYLHVGNQFGVRPGILFENSTVGTLSTDANFLYAVEDLQVPEPTSPFGMEFGGRFNQPGGNQHSAELNDALQHNRLRAIEISTGKLKWELGDPSRKDELSDCYFLGPPLPLGGKLYVLTERQQELRLVCIDPAPPMPRVVAMQTLATTRDKLQTDVTRRTEAALLAYSEGILVCPTNAGAVLGVDLLSNSLVWAYPYREKSESEEWRPGMGRGMPPGIIGPDGRPMGVSTAQQWKVSAPVLIDGKAVFTAPDSRSLHCVNLRDGAPLWKVRRAEDDQFLAGVFAGRVLIVGKKTVRALSLEKGETVWALDTGLPSGQGVASENIYYLPLKEAGQGKEPEICAIDVEKGRIVAHTKSRKKEVPGNLLFYEGDVISQTATDVVAFPQLKVKLAEIDELISKNPDDPVGLTERGVLRLDEGNLQGAIDDLDKALANHPDNKTEERARAKLFETLTEFFQRDFDKAERYLARYRDLCKVPVPEGAGETDRNTAESEERRRRANFLCLVAKGKESQGKLVEAFEYYQQFSAAAGSQELISVVDEPAVRAAPDVWSQGRIAAMAANATPEARKPLEERLAKRWDEVRNSEDPEELKKFVAVFGSRFEVGKEARLALAERLIDSSDARALVEAERHLSLLRRPGEAPKVAARAVECLARLCTRKGLLEDAAFFYQLLGKDYPNEIVRDGRSGAEVFNELATDKRFLPLLDMPAQAYLRGRVKMIEERGTYSNEQQHQQEYIFEQRGEALPFFRENRVALYYGGQMHQIWLVDRATGDVRWKQPVTMTQFGNMAYGNGMPNMPRYKYQTLGHLVVLHAGRLVFGIDPVHKLLLWEQNLTTGQSNSPRQMGGMAVQDQITVDQDGSVDITYQDGWRQRLGQAGPLGANTVCVQTREALLALDPVTGRTVWTRSDVNPHSHLFGDEDIIFVVEMSEHGPLSTKAMRASDGVSVKVPDFTAVYAKRLRVLGNLLLLSETDVTTAPTLSLYDVKTGKTLWKEKFGAGARVLQSEDPYLTGVLDGSGRLRVVDLRSVKTVLDTKLPSSLSIDKSSAVHLLSDGKYFFIAFSDSNDVGAAAFAAVQPMLMSGSGLRGQPVNGPVCCFRDDGKLNWYTVVNHQILVLEQFADLPVVLFASRSQRMGPGALPRPGSMNQVVSSVSAYEKQTGKLKYLNENVPSNIFFHSLNVDTRAGRVDFIGGAIKISFVLEGDTGTGKPKADRPEDNSRPSPPDGTRKVSKGAADNGQQPVKARSPVPD